MTNDSPDRTFIIFDRDGTLIEEREYLSEPSQVKLLPGVGQCLRDLRSMGFGLIVITNQSGVGRGFFTEAQLKSIHERLAEILKTEGVQLDGLYYCPHRPDDMCLCRKPGTSLIRIASKELKFDPERAIVVGDKASDIEMGSRVGARTVLVQTGYGAQVAEAPTVVPDYIVRDLASASALIGRLWRESLTDCQG